MHNNKPRQAVVLLNSAPNWAKDFAPDALRGSSVLCIGGFDPSGGAGVLADARMIEALGGHACALITLHTCQGRTRWAGASAAPLEQLHQQWRALHGSLPIHAIKIGALANLEQAIWVAELICALGVPAVLDPVRHSSSGGALSDDGAIQHLLAHVQLITPNHDEAAALFGTDSPASAPCAVLVTATDQAQQQGAKRIRHELYGQGQTTYWDSPLLEGRFRGSGCMLASAIAGYLGRDYSLQQAITESLRAVELSLRQAWTFDDGVHLPRIPR